MTGNYNSHSLDFYCEVVWIYQTFPPSEPVGEVAVASLPVAGPVPWVCVSGQVTHNQGT